MANSKEEVNVSKMYKEDCLSSKEEFMNKNNVKETGLSSKEAILRLRNNGYNVIKKGKPKKWYRVDRFLHKIPNSEVAKVYRQCDILLKTSILESFSYPPLEMMATGGYVVAVPNEGNIEYLKNGENCLFYPAGEIQKAVRLIEQLCKDSDLQETLYQKGVKTANSREWDLLQSQILQLYMTEGELNVERK